ncbi:MAG: hypothetical protein NXH74_07760 [Rhodobacteraceae bacterium]|jgi:hypothetical protein|nr:hypothetical protein [Paracoccaceae bacterium]
MRGAAVMPRGIMAFPLLAVALGGVALALLLGGRAVTTTETEVIERVAARYMAEGGAARSDCHARPAQSDGLWLVVICEAGDGGGMEYFIDRFGRVADVRRVGGL